MRRLNFSRRFALLGLLLIIAISVILVNFHKSLEYTIRTANLELDGTALIVSLSKTLQLVQQHRGLSLATLNGSKELAQRRIILEKETAAAFESLQKSLSTNASLSIGGEAISADWNRIRKEGLKWSIRENFDTHTKIALQLIALESLVADRYHMSADPQIDSSHLIHAITSSLPQALENLGQLRAYGSGILIKKKISESQKTQLNSLVGQFKSTLDNFTTKLDDVNQYAPKAPQSISLKSNNFSIAAHDIVNRINTDIMDSAFELSAEDFFLKSTSTIDTGYEQIYQALIPELQQLLKARIQLAEHTLYLSIGIVLVLCLTVTYLAIAIYLVMIKNLSKLGDSAHILATGDLHERVNINTRDELALVGKSFNEIADGFQKLHEALRLNETQLKFERNQLQTLIKTIPDLVWLKDINGTYLNCNPRFEDFVGEKADYIIGKTDVELFDKTHADTYKMHDMDVLQKKSTLKSEESITFADGHTELLEKTKSTVFDSDGSVIGILGVARDITERKQAEDIIKVSRDQFSTIFNQSPLGIAVVESNTGNILNVNKKYTDILGRTLEELTNTDWMSITHPDDIQKDLDNMSLMIAGKTDGFTMEKRLMRSDSSYVWINMTISTLMQDKLTSPCHLAMIEDISERKQDEDKLKLAANVFTHARP